MNNSFIPLGNVETLTPSEPIDRTPWLRQKESELVLLIETLQRVSSSQDWSTLKSSIFDGVVENLEKQLLDEAKQDKPDTLKLASLNGQFIWAKKYADLDSLASAFRVELSGIRKQLK